MHIFDKPNNDLEDLFNENRKSGVFVFIDAIDEVTIDNIDNLVAKLINIQKNNVTIIATCRKEEHEAFLRINSNYAKIFDRLFEICDWQGEQLSCYIRKYEKHAISNDFNIRINKYLYDRTYSDFFKTPLEISLMFFIVDQSSCVDPIKNQYELYEQFLKKWIIRDCVKNGIAYENNDYIDETMYYFSLCAYFISVNSKVLSNYLLNQFPSLKEHCLNGLLRYDRENERKYIVGFYHLNFLDFFLSYFFIHSLMKISEKTIQALSIRYNHTVTRLIKNKLSFFDDKDLDNIKMTLLTVILKVCRIPNRLLKIRNINLPKKASNYFDSLSEDIKTVVRNEIYFFLARIPWNKNNADFLHILQIAYQYEPDIRAKRTIAISATILGGENLELQYAKEILYDANSNLIDRSFTLVYYQDVPHSNPFTYIDDNITQWTNSRSSRINRLKSTDIKSLRMRSFDLITILNFAKSRNGYRPTQLEYNIIRDCDINCTIYSSEKKKLLYEVKKELLNYLVSN